MSRQLMLSFLLLLYIPVVAAAPGDVIITDAELMQTVFGDAGAVTSDQVTLTAAQRDWIEGHFRITQEPQTVSVQLSRDASGRIMVGLIKQDIVYQGQTITVAIGLSAELRVIRAAVTSAPAPLRRQLEASIGAGYLKRYTMMSARQLGYLANVLNKEGQPTAMVANQLFKSGAILAAIIRTGE